MLIDSKNIVSYKKAVGLKVKTVRKAKGLSQTTLATLCDVEKTSISRIENGRTNITLSTAVILCTALEIPLKELFDVVIKKE